MTVALKEQFVVHQGPGWRNLVDWPAVARTLGPRYMEWSRMEQAMLFDRAILLAYKLKMSRAQFICFLDRAMCVPIPANPWATTPRYETCFFRKAIEAYDASLLPAYERLLQEDFFPDRGGPWWVVGNE